MTSYDERHLTTYLRLLDADAEGADWREVVTLLFGLNPKREPDRLACVAWNQRMLGFKEPAQPSPSLGDALNAGYLYLEVRCLESTFPQFPQTRKNIGASRVGSRTDKQKITQIDFSHL